MVYAKTQKGLDEIRTRASQLPFKLRQVLIMIDGTRTNQDLAGVITNSDHMADDLRFLEENGFITGSGGIPAAAHSGTSTPAPFSVSPVPAKAPTQSLDGAKRYLSYFVRNMLGEDADKLVADIERSRTADELMVPANVCATLMRDIGGDGEAREFLQSIKKLLSSPAE